MRAQGRRRFEGPRDGRHLRAARGRARASQDRDFVEHHDRVFDEHGIGQVRLGGEFDEPAAKRGEGPDVVAVLLARDRDVDRRTCEVGEFAALHA